jgi:hypothetical protein
MNMPHSDIDGVHRPLSGLHHRENAHMYVQYMLENDLNADERCEPFRRIFIYPQICPEFDLTLFSVWTFVARFTFDVECYVLHRGTELVLIRVCLDVVDPFRLLTHHRHMESMSSKRSMEQSIDTDERVNHAELPC